MVAPEKDIDRTFTVPNLGECIGIILNSGRVTPPILSIVGNVHFGCVAFEL